MVSKPGWYNAINEHLVRYCEAYLVLCRIIGATLAIIAYKAYGWRGVALVAASFALMAFVMPLLDVARDRREQ